MITFRKNPLKYIRVNWEAFNFFRKEAAKLRLENPLMNQSTIYTLCIEKWLRHVEATGRKDELWTDKSQAFLDALERSRNDAFHKQFEKNMNQEFGKVVSLFN